MRPPCSSKRQPLRNWPCSRKCRPGPARASAQLDAKAKALIAWLRDTIRPNGTWSQERVILFTEYRATQNWLQGVFATEGFTGGDRLLTMYGGMDDRTTGNALKRPFKPRRSRVRCVSCLPPMPPAKGLTCKIIARAWSITKFRGIPTGWNSATGALIATGKRLPQVRVYHFVAQGYKSANGG